MAFFPELSAAEWASWFKALPWLAQTGVVFTGGEPTMHAEFHDVLTIAVNHCAVEVYTNMTRKIDWARVPTFGHLHWRASCHAQTAAEARAWLAHVDAGRAAGQRFTLTTVLPPPEVVEVLRPYGVTVDAPQQRPTALPPPVDCMLPRILVGPDGRRYRCVGKLVRRAEDGVLDHMAMGWDECLTPDQCAKCDSLSSQRRLL